MTHALAYLAGVVTALCLVWGWVGAQASEMGDDPMTWGDDA